MKLNNIKEAKDQIQEQMTEVVSMLFKNLNQSNVEAKASIERELADAKTTLEFWETKKSEIMTALEMNFNTIISAQKTKIEEIATLFSEY